MLEPRYKRVNTIAVRFNEGERDRDIVKVLLRDIFKIKASEIGGVGNEGRNSIHVKFKSVEIYEHICNKHHGKIIRIDEYNTEVILEDVSTYTTKVTMRNIPFEFPNAQLTRILQSYGTVRTIVENAVKDDYFEYAPDSERIAYMDTIHHPIPSTLFVNLIATPIYFSYAGQIPTCNRCGDKSHLTKDCVVSNRKNKNVYIRPENRPNSFILSDENFPSLPDSKTSQVRSVITKQPENGSGTPYADAQDKNDIPEISSVPIPSKISTTPTHENVINATMTNEETLDNVINSEIITQEKNPFIDNNKQSSPADNNVSTLTMNLDNNRENILSVKGSQVNSQQQNNVLMYSSVV